MKRILASLSATLAFTLLAGCVGGGTYDPYYGSGYRSSPYTSQYRYYDDDRRNGSNYYSRDRYYYDGRNYYRR